MSAVLTPPAPQAVTPPPSSVIQRPAPQPYRWTVDEYQELGKAGFFRDKKTMLLNGELYVMVFPNPPHDVALGLTDDWLRTVFASGHHVRNQMGFNVGTRNNPGPDLAVVVGSVRDYSARTPTTAVLIVEIADSSLMTDLTTKAELYATAGVPEYWVLDLDGRELIVFRDPQPLPAGLGATAYRTRLTLTAADTVSPLAAPTATVRLADLLP